MPDNLKKYIVENRENVDQYPFDADSGWNEIKDRLRTRPSRMILINRVWAYSAIALLCLALATVLLAAGGRGAGQMPKEVLEVQSYYQTMIDVRMVQLQSRIEDEALLEDIEALDIAFTELKADLQDDAQNAEVVEAMIENYRLKLQILERVLKNLEEDDHEENSSI